MGEPRRSRRLRGLAPASSNDGSGKDRISSLPDELLHDILVRLGSADAAARTSVLSRRWQHVWAHLPELRFVVPRAVAPEKFMDSVDAALGRYLAPTLEHLGVIIGTNKLGLSHRVPSGRIVPWLHFAAEHVVGELYIYLFEPQKTSKPKVHGEVVLDLPVCEKAKQIVLLLCLYDRATRLRPQPGVFTALTCLNIGANVRMEGSDITNIVCAQCPCLRDLSLSIELVVNFDVSINSDWLCTLVFRVLKTRRLEVMAPRLEELTMNDQPMEAHISAPKLVKVSWHCAYDPRLHQFVDVGRNLRLLQTLKQATSLTKRFDEVDKLCLEINLQDQDVATYRRFLNETNKLPKCNSFSLSLFWEYHALVPIMLHLLRSCNGTKELSVQLFRCYSQLFCYCLPSCPCQLEETRKVDGIDLSSLEVVQINGFSGSPENMELLEFLSCNAENLKKLLIDDKLSQSPKEAREKVCSIYHPNVKVEYYAFRDGAWVTFD